MAFSDYFEDKDGQKFWLNYSRPADTLRKNLPAGVYDFVQVMEGSYFRPVKIATDKLLEIKDPVHQRVLSEVTQFFSSDIKAKFAKYEILYRRGILLYGKPGTGKTCIIKQVIEEAVKEDFVVLNSRDVLKLTEAIKKVREIEGPNRKVLIILEELDDILLDYESYVLELLDGINSFDNVLYLATTNYIDQIPARVKSRPSRFASVIEVKAPGKEARTLFLKDKMKIESSSEIKRFVGATDGMVLDQVKDVVISVCCFDLSLEDAVKRIKEAEELCKEDEDEDEDEEI